MVQKRLWGHILDSFRVKKINKQRQMIFRVFRHNIPQNCIYIYLKYWNRLEIVKNFPKYVFYIRESEAKRCKCVTGDISVSSKGVLWSSDSHLYIALRSLHSVCFVCGSDWTVFVCGRDFWKKYCWNFL